MRIRFAVSIASFSSLAGGFTKVEWTWTICYVSVNSKTTYQPVPALPMVFKLAARNIKAAKCQVPLARNNGHTFTHSRQHPDTKANDQLAGSICDKRRTPWSQPEVLCSLHVLRLITVAIVTREHSSTLLFSRYLQYLVNFIKYFDPMCDTATLLHVTDSTTWTLCD